MGSRWEKAAHSELEAPDINAGVCHHQVEDSPVYRETGTAIEALEEADRATCDSAKRDDHGYEKAY